MSEQAPAKPSLPLDKLILYVVKTSPTSGNNVLKPMMLIECLQLDYHVEVISTQKDTWFGAINPLRLVPAIEDIASADGTRAQIFESSACLQYIAAKYDVKGEFCGRNDAERAQVASWSAMHEAGLASHAKWWLTLKRKEGAELGQTLDIMIAAVKQQYQILDDRLSQPNQRFIALVDRPSIADFATLAFANEKVAGIADIDFGAYANLKEWSERMMAVEGVTRAYKKVQTFGTTPKCCSSEGVNGA